MTLASLKNARKDANLTMEDMGEALHISKVAYWKIEHGQTKMSLESAIKISKILDADINSLFSPFGLTKSELTDTPKEVS